MPAPALFADVLDRKTRGAAPLPRRMGLWAPQSVWLYALPVVDLNRTRPAADWVSVVFRDGDITESTPEARSGAATWREDEGGADGTTPESGGAKVPRPPRELSAAARAALTILRGLGADELDDRFTQIEVKRAFRLLAMRLHPDRHPNASASERAHLARAFSSMTDAIGLLLASV